MTTVSYRNGAFFFQTEAGRQEMISRRQTQSMTELILTLVLLKSDEATVDGRSVLAQHATPAEPLTSLATCAEAASWSLMLSSAILLESVRMKSVSATQTLLRAVRSELSDGGQKEEGVRNAARRRRDATESLASLLARCRGTAPVSRRSSSPSNVDCLNLLLAKMNRCLFSV